VRVRVSAQRRLEEVGELRGAVGDVALELGVGERVDDVAQRREALQMQGGAGRCGEMRGDAAES